MEKRKEIVHRWKNTHRDKVIAQKWRNRAKHANRENEKLKAWQKKKLSKKSRPRKDGIDKKEIPVNEPSRGNGRL